MKVFISLITLIFVSNAHAAYLDYCTNFSSPYQAVSYVYESCVNRNFDRVEFEMENHVYLQRCMNFGRKVEYSFTSCINRNFDEIAREMNYKVFLNHCYNYNDKELSYMFQSCVNRNFDEVERELNRSE